MQDVAVIEDAAAAEVSLDPIRARMLAELAEPHTATTLAARLGLARQKVNYHVKTLEQHGLVELVEERRKGNMTERVVRASAAAYVISPAALAAVAPDPAQSPDRLSARWLLALAARLVRETGALINVASGLLARAAPLMSAPVSRTSRAASASSQRADSRSGDRAGSGATAASAAGEIT